MYKPITGKVRYIRQYKQSVPACIAFVFSLAFYQIRTNFFEPIDCYVYHLSYQWIDIIIYLIYFKIYILKEKIFYIPTIKLTIN
ncbi:hypothetical protein Cthe_0281 [Acetivibrio thermocellus ATCC 27405]|uniref:Uncharacterized protein n=1 Tax=Acetivibrio thermocellus (strain ATCC 27405 / DSM 1237 / JCM 9322 / NBRC 103400 / NCIMB 10682 / NRRL B-4536 / VPI 7372) TaxID=203119 RepID=A3DC41_ACET2|nr:hypothetical protein Cthe_0281 [Acetivibrio thermocellus ATCC 27405]